MDGWRSNHSVTLRNGKNKIREKTATDHTGEVTVAYRFELIRAEKIFFFTA